MGTTSNSNHNMEIKHKKITVQELVDLYENIRFIFSDSYKIVASYGYDDNKDCRNVLYKLLIEAAQTNVILFHLIGEHFGNLKIWEKQNFISEQQKEEFLRNRLGFIISDLRENLFVNVFLRFENFIKLISDSQNLTGEKINKLSKDLIDKLGLDQDYKNLIDLLTHIRNTIHTEGFHTRDDKTITYKGKSFELKKDHPATFYNEDFLHFLIEEINSFFLEIINSNNVKSISFIEHTFSGITHTYEE